MSCVFYVSNLMTFNRKFFSIITQPSAAYTVQLLQIITVLTNTFLNDWITDVSCDSTQTSHVAGYLNISILTP